MARRGRRGLFSITRYVRRAGFYKGILGGQRGWLGVAGVLWLGRFVRRGLGGTEELVHRQRIEPGQTLQFVVVTPPTRAERKADRALADEVERAAKRQRKERRSSARMAG